MRVIMKDKEGFLRDPVFFFLALAFVDEALLGIDSVDQFWMIRPSGNRKQFDFQWNPTVLDTPVFQLTDSTGGISQAWNDTSMYYLLRGLIRIARYEAKSITVHSIRRGFASCIDSRV